HCYPKDAYIYFEGDPSEMLYVMWVGQVKLLRHSDRGRDVVLEIIGPGRMFGEVAVLEGTPYDTSAQCLEDTAVVAISREDFFAILKRYPAVSLAVIGELSRRLRSTTDLVRSLAVDRVEQRIARILLKLASATGRPTEQGLMIDIPLTRQDIADMTGTTVETAIRVMSRLRREKLVITQRGRVTILEPERLRQVAEER
ncbi:MAG TPA: Crp/Fnr family transcriptional regulator, partial [Anaerolineae bacterium]|nr:Crp/Fnr family transcriptional regulator [Anaerolineae bacterium]